MKSPKSNDKKRGRVSLRLLLGIALLGMLPAFLWAQAPGWWSSRGVLVSGTNITPNDYAAVNQGQLKNLATAAYQELNANLPGGVGDMTPPDTSGSNAGTGYNLTALISKWSNAPTSGTEPLVINSGSTTNDYAAVNLGQLKTVAKPFYDRLIQVGYTAQYPWTTSTNAANDYAMANIGQVKNLFSFDVAFDGDVPPNGLPDWWESKYFGHTGIDAAGSAQGVAGLSNLDSFNLGLNPIDYYNGAAPSLAVISGNGQVGVARQVLAPLIVKATDSHQNALSSAPLQFAVSGSTGTLSLTGSGMGATSQILRTGADGCAQVYLTLPNTPNTDSVVTVTPVSYNNPQAIFIAHCVYPPTGIIAAGANHSLAIGADGTLWSWGLNYSGQLGIGSNVDAWTPMKVNLTGTSTAVSVAAGASHSAMVASDGTVWTCGDNGNGQLGVGTTSSTNAFVQVPGLTGFVAVAAGDSYTLALKNDGTVWAWGYNGYGTLGDGTYSTRYAPVQVPGLNNIMAIAAGGNGSFALDKDGYVWSWGFGGNGELGDGRGVSRNIPDQIGTISGVIAISVGHDHAVVIKGDGTIRTWGNNGAGQLGTGNTTDSYAPVSVAGLTTGVIAIAAGQYHTVAVKSDGTVYAWGYNQYGQLGDGTTVQRNAPVLVNGVSGIAGIAAGNHTIALGSDGSLFGWGCNTYGQVGIETNINAPTPSLLTSLTFAPQVAKPTLSLEGGMYLQAQTVTVSCATIGASLYYTTDGSEPTVNSASVVSGGTVLVSQTGELRVKAFVGGLAPSVTKSGSYRIGSQVFAGANHSLAIGADGTLWSWGLNYSGQLGIGSNVDAWTPMKVNLTGALTAVSAAAGASHSAMVASDGTVWTCGDNSWGKLGVGTSSTNTFVQVPGLTGFVTVAAGDSHTLALKNDGTVWAWGYNGRYQLGDGTSDSRNTPMQVLVLNNIIAIAAGENNSFALDKDGYVWAWGNGTLGDDRSSYRSIPARLGAISNVIAISSVHDHAVALRGDGTVWTWGANDYGQLGIGNTTSSDFPVKITGTTGLTTGVIAIAAGQYYTVAVKNDGTVWAWGDDQYGQLGDGTLGDANNRRLAPVQAIGLSGITEIAAGNHTVAITKDGALWTCGNNSNGQLGNNTNGTVLLTPAPIDPLPFARKIPEPYFDLEGGVYNTIINVRINIEWAGATLHYTTDGKEPTINDPIIDAGGTLAVTESEVIMVRAFFAGLEPSAIHIASYIIHPVPTSDDQNDHTPPTIYLSSPSGLVLEP